MSSRNEMHRNTSWYAQIFLLLLSSSCHDFVDLRNEHGAVEDASVGGRAVDGVCARDARRRRAHGTRSLLLAVRCSLCSPSCRRVALTLVDNRQLGAALVKLGYGGMTANKGTLRHISLRNLLF
jgi:hypothetical protein